MKYLIFKIWNKIKLFLWTYSQPLTKSPTNKNSSVSDLFVWRASKDIETFFELIDIPSLFLDYEHKNHVTLVVFDSNGNELLSDKIELIPNRRSKINISEIIKEKSMLVGSASNFGTFAIFHSIIPSVFNDTGSFISECGYVSYSYKNALNTYVHGNLEAIALLEDDSYELLCVPSFLQRKFNLQFELKDSALYELGLVNPTNKMQSVVCSYLSLENGRVVKRQEVDICPKGSFVFDISVQKGSSIKVVIKSKLVMARPLIFRKIDDNLDVIHG